MYNTIPGKSVHQCGAPPWSRSFFSLSQSSTL